MITIAVTFGTAHNEEHQNIIPEGSLSEGYVVIEAPNWAIARSIALAVFGQKFAFDYDYQDFMDRREKSGLYRRGELLRIAWQPGGSR